MQMVHYIYWLEPKKVYQRRDKSQHQRDPIDQGLLGMKTVVERSDSMISAATRLRPAPAEPSAQTYLNFESVKNHLSQYYKNPGEAFQTWYKDSALNFHKRRIQHIPTPHQGIFWDHFNKPVKVYDGATEFPLIPATVKKRRTPLVIDNFLTSPIKSQIETEIGLQVLLNDPFETVAYI